MVSGPKGILNKIGVEWACRYSMGQVSPYNKPYKKYQHLHSFNGEFWPRFSSNVNLPPWKSKPKAEVARPPNQPYQLNDVKDEALEKVLKFRRLGLLGSCGEISGGDLRF